MSTAAADAAALRRLYNRLANGAGCHQLVALLERRAARRRAQPALRVTLWHVAAAWPSADL